LRGEHIADLVNGYADAGAHSVTWNAGESASGIYFLRLETGGITITDKLIYTK